VPQGPGLGSALGPQPLPYRPAPPRSGGRRRGGSGPEAGGGPNQARGPERKRARAGPGWAGGGDCGADARRRLAARGRLTGRAPEPRGAGGPHPRACLTGPGVLGWRSSRMALRELGRLAVLRWRGGRCRCEGRFATGPSPSARRGRLAAGQGGPDPSRPCPLKCRLSAGDAARVRHAGTGGGPTASARAGRLRPVRRSLLPSHMTQSASSASVPSQLRNRRAAQ
jgi:hypothetical protein